jgi:hypothetical protein
MVDAEPRERGRCPEALGGNLRQEKRPWHRSGTKGESNQTASVRQHVKRTAWPCGALFSSSVSPQWITPIDSSLPPL